MANKGKQLKPYVDLTGKRFGMLEVIECVGTPPGKKRKYWKCKCDCGQFIERSSDSFKMRENRNQKTLCCRQIGCLTGDYSPNWKGHGDISGNLWDAISRQHQRVDKRKSRSSITFEITIDYAWDLFLKQDRKCALTGFPIKFGDKKYGKGRTASLDRIDNNKGYIEGNVQWVHKDINKMKNTHEQNYFIELCRAVAQHNKNDTTSKEVDCEERTIE